MAMDGVTGTGLEIRPLDLLQVVERQAPGGRM